MNIFNRKSTSEESKLYNDAYFEDRLGNNPKRQISFLQEKKFINKYVNSGAILDVGCSTGEFLTTIQWNGPKYGMEVSEYAINIAKKAGISFERNLFNTENYFDIVVYRGTIQHIDTPFHYLKLTQKALKPKGFVVFLATPNTNCIYYKLWNTLPFLDQERNYFIPSDRVLINSLNNLGFNFVDIEFPYIKSPYANFLSDHIKFAFKMFGFNYKFPFWRNSMNLICQKRKNC